MAKRILELKPTEVPGADMYLAVDQYEAGGAGTYSSKVRHVIGSVIGKTATLAQGGASLKQIAETGEIVLSHTIGVPAGNQHEGGQMNLYFQDGAYAAVDVYTDIDGAYKNDGEPFGANNKYMRLMCPTTMGEMPCLLIKCDDGGLYRPKSINDGTNYVPLDTGSNSTGYDDSNVRTLLDGLQDQINNLDATQQQMASVSATPPAGAKQGRLWWDTSNATMYVHDGSHWVITNPHGGNPLDGISVPVGSVVPWAGVTPPAGDPGWMLCDGRMLQKDQYPELAAAIGYTYGGSDDDFSIPDLRGRVVAGQDDMGSSEPAGRLTSDKSGLDGTVLGETGGLEDHKLIIAEMPIHNHPVPASGGTSRGNDGPGEAAGNVRGTSGPAGEDIAHNNVQPTIILNYLIRVKNTASDAPVVAIEPVQTGLRWKSSNFSAANFAAPSRQDYYNLRSAVRKNETDQVMHVIFKYDADQFSDRNQFSIFVDKTSIHTSTPYHAFTGMKDRDQQYSNFVDFWINPGSEYYIHVTRKQGNKTDDRFLSGLLVTEHHFTS